MENDKEKFSDIFYQEPIEMPGNHPSQDKDVYFAEISQDIYKKEFVEALIKQNTYLQEKVFEMEMELDDLRYNRGNF